MAENLNDEFASVLPKPELRQGPRTQMNFEAQEFSMIFGRPAGGLNCLQYLKAQLG